MSNKLDGITLHAEGEANCYRLMRGGNWLAAIRMNGELLVWDQEDILRAMLQGEQKASQHINVGDLTPQQRLELSRGTKAAPVAYITGQFAGRCIIEAINRAAVLPTGMALYATPQPSAVPDAVTMADVMRAWEYAEDHPHKYLRGTTNWCAAVAHSLNKQRASAPATVQGVNTQLLEALEELMYAHTDKAEALATAAIAAARKG